MLIFIPVKIFLRAAGLLITVVLSSCFSSDNEPHHGVGTGLVGNSQGLAMIDVDGELRILRPGVVYAGKLTTSGNTVATDITTYLVDSGPFSTATNTQAYTGQFKNGLVFNPVDPGSNSAGEQLFGITFFENEPASFSRLMGTGEYALSSSSGASYVLTMTFNSDGLITGADSNACTYLGQVQINDSTINLYTLSLTVSTCGDFDGVYSGGAIITQPSAGVDLVNIVVTNNEHAFSAGIVK